MSNEFCVRKNIFLTFLNCCYSTDLLKTMQRANISNIYNIVNILEVQALTKNGNHCSISADRINCCDHGRGGGHHDKQEFPLLLIFPPKYIMVTRSTINTSLVQGPPVTMAMLLNESSK